MNKQRYNPSLLSWLSNLKVQIRLAIRRFAERNNLSIEQVTDMLETTHSLYISETGQCAIIPKDTQEITSYSVS